MHLFRERFHVWLNRHCFRIWKQCKSKIKIINIISLEMSTYLIHMFSSTSFSKCKWSINKSDRSTINLLFSCVKKILDSRIDLSALKTCNYHHFILLITRITFVSFLIGNGRGTIWSDALCMLWNAQEQNIQRLKFGNVECTCLKWNGLAMFDIKFTHDFIHNSQ